VKALRGRVVCVLLSWCWLSPLAACGLDREGPAAIALPERPSGDPPPTPIVEAGSDVDASLPPPDLGKWYQANAIDCPPFCAGKGMKNIASPEGAKCTSGENIPPSAIEAKIQYDVCWPDCTVHYGTNVKSYGRECYADGQNQDGDRSDETRGCFCK
jgi:hypothetical protein